MLHTGIEAADEGAGLGREGGGGGGGGFSLGPRQPLDPSLVFLIVQLSEVSPMQV